MVVEIEICSTSHYNERYSTGNEALPLPLGGVYNGFTTFDTSHLQSQ